MFDEELLLIGEDGAPFFDKSKPISYIIRGKSWVNNHAHVLRALYGITSNQYLKYFLDQFDFHDYVNGTTRLKLTQASMNSITVKLAPFNEQRRIVARLEKLLGCVDGAQARLATIPLILKRFRQSVLAAAVDGSITRDWRTARPTGALAVNHNRRNDVPFEVPPGWSWVRNQDLAYGENGAIGAGPFGTIFKAKDFRQIGVPIIFLRHVGPGRYITDKPGFMDKQKWEELFRNYSVYGGELLVTKLGDPPGTSAIYPIGIGLAMVTPDVIKMKVNDKLVNSRYLMHFFNSPVSTRIMFGLAFGVTRLRIDLPMFRDLLVPLPPLSEQNEIVRRVEALFKTADALEARYQKAKAHVDKLTQSILAKAFRGELVPQDPNDEPASVLLQRLRQEPSATFSGKKRRR